MFLSLIIYSKENHYFNYQEMMNNWGLNIEEKKFLIFLKKKKAFNEF